MRKRKTLQDFPQFVVSGVRRGTTSDTGYIRFELDGKFDRVIDDIDQHWFWLLFDDNDCISTKVNSLDKESRAAILTCDEREEPKVIGKTLAYLSPYWQAYNVWMVLDPAWGWTRKRFQGTDAVAENYDAGETSFVAGREVRVWTKLESVSGRGEQSRHYPASDQTLPSNPERRLVPGGWGHEHCDLCKSHVESGRFGYCDPSGRWMCEKCYERYVLPHDLFFVDEL